MSDSRSYLHDTILSRVFLRADESRRMVLPNGRPSAWIFDFRTVALEPAWLDRYSNIFWELFENRLPFQVGGMETAAIPLVSAIVMKGRERGTPVSGFYIRKSRDRDGLLKRIEGTLTDNPVILVDDIINSGGSFEKQLKVLEAEGKTVSDIFTILAFRERGAYAFATDRGIRVRWLFTLEDFGLPLEKATVRDMPEDRLTVEWKFSAGDPGFEWVVQKSAPVVDDRRVYFGTDKGTFYALEQTSGDIAWQLVVDKHPVGKGISSCATLYNGVIYFGAYDGCVYAVDAATGTMRWKYDDADWIGSSPALAPELGLLFVGLEFGLWRKQGGIAALDMQTGKRTWQDRTPALTHGSPRYIEQEDLVVIGSNDGVVYAYDARSGERRWTYQTGHDVKTRPDYDNVRRIVLVPSMDSHLYALSAADGQPRWGFQTGAGIYSNPLVDGNRVLIASLDKSLYSLDLDSGKPIARFDTSGRIFASPVLADGSLWIGSNDGKLYELDPVTLDFRGSHQFSDRIVNAICHNPATERFFVPTIANELFCLKRSVPMIHSKG
jgi:outer membrane protein assembly factor BamB